MLLAFRSLPHALVSTVALAFVIITMLGELLVSRRNERRLLERGAVEPPDPVYATMRWAYPAAFAVMAAEGVFRDGATGAWTIIGLLIFAAGKLLKYWAIATLGDRWTYRVLVLPAEPLVQIGPYRLLRHPNYVGVVGELVGMALLTGAVVTGPPATLFFGWLLQRRIHAEERALGTG